MAKNIKDIYISELKARVALSIFVIYTFTLLSIYNLLVEVFTTLQKGNHPTTFATAAMLFAFSIGLIIMIRHMGYPLSRFGFNLNHWKKYLLESLFITAIFCVLLLGLKWVLISYFPLFQHLPLFFHNTQFNPVAWTIAAFVYAAFAFVQAFIIQGSIQSSLMGLIRVRYATICSVIISSLVFGAVHIDLNFVYAFSVLIPGVMWAMMYARQRSLLGVSISHAIVGLWAFWGLGFFQIFEILSGHLGLNAF